MDSFRWTVLYPYDSCTSEPSIVLVLNSAQWVLPTRISSRSADQSPLPTRRVWYVYRVVSVHIKDVSRHTASSAQLTVTGTSWLSIISNDIDSCQTDRRGSANYNTAACLSVPSPAAIGLTSRVFVPRKLPLPAPVNTHFTRSRFMHGCSSWLRWIPSITDKIQEGAVSFSFLVTK